jgi:hypothetical protein
LGDFQPLAIIMHRLRQVFPMFWIYAVSHCANDQSKRLARKRKIPAQTANITPNDPGNCT